MGTKGATGKGLCYSKFITSATCQNSPSKRKVVNSCALVNLNTVFKNKSLKGSVKNASHKNRRVIKTRDTHRIPKNNLVGKDLQLVENMIDGKIRKRLCSAKPNTSNKNQRFNLKNNTDYVELNFVVNDNENDMVEFLVAQTPKSKKIAEDLNRTAELKTKEASKLQLRDFMSKIRLSESEMRLFK